jgi:hypothetical protein
MPPLPCTDPGRLWPSWSRRLLSAGRIDCHARRSALDPAQHEVLDGIEADGTARNGVAHGRRNWASGSSRGATFKESERRENEQARARAAVVPNNARA